MDRRAMRRANHIWRRQRLFAAIPVRRFLQIQFLAQPVKKHVDQEGTAQQSKRR